MNYGDLIPDYLQDELLVIRDQERESRFRIGDITNELIGAPKEQIYSAVGLFVGKAARTVREYSAVSKFYSPEVRERYSMLSYEYFRVAMRYKDRWQEALEWCLFQGNRPATVDAMEMQYAEVEGNENFGDVMKDYRVELCRILESLKGVLYYVELDKDIVRDLIGLIEKLEVSMKIETPPR